MTCKKLLRSENGPSLRNQHGIPTGDSTSDKERSPSVTKGPLLRSRWGDDPNEVLQWAEARLRSTRQDRVPEGISTTSTEGRTDRVPGQASNLPPTLPKPARKVGRKTLVLDSDLAAFLEGLPTIGGGR